MITSTFTTTTTTKSSTSSSSSSSSSWDTTQNVNVNNTNVVSHRVAILLFLCYSMMGCSDAFATTATTSASVGSSCCTTIASTNRNVNTSLTAVPKQKSHVPAPLDCIRTYLTSSMLALTLLVSNPILTPAENELSAKYGNNGLDTSLVDQTCLVNQCGTQAKACLADDPNCRKGLTCTAKCLGDNACITGCMARYGNSNLDHLLKCTIEEHECIKVAILPGGADKREDAPKSPAPTVTNFQMESMTGTWYKVVGYNPNYDCYACQRNTFHIPQQDASVSSAGVSPTWDNILQKKDRLEMDVEFSMPHLLPDGSPPPPSGARETIVLSESGNLLKGSQSIGFNEYATHEVMVFDGYENKNDNLQKFSNLVFGEGTEKEQRYARTAHSEGEMFGLKFWENWYIIGENDPDQEEFKFVYYNGKTRQNTYEGAFVYSRTKELSPANMEKVYSIADAAGLQPDNFCKIQNGCFKDSAVNVKKQGADYPFRGILASTKVSQFFGVQPVVAEGDAPVLKRAELDKAQSLSASEKRAWWYEVGDYLENPHRHFKAMDRQRQVMDWPDDIKERVMIRNSAR